MRLLAAFSGGVFAYLLVGCVTGRVPARAFSRRRRVGRSGVPAALRTPLLATSAVAALAVFGALWALSGALAVGVAPAVAAGCLPRAWARRRADRIDRDRIAAWPDALRQLVAHLQAPMSLHRSLVELARSGPQALRPAWRRYERLSGALDNRAALEAVRDELADAVSDRVVEVLLVAQRQGDALVLDVLRDLAATTARDVALREEIETAQLERRIESRAAAVMPFAVLVLLCSTSAPYRTFYSSARGLAVVAVGSVMVAAGFMLIRRLGRLPVERRVMATGRP